MIKKYCHEKITLLRFRRTEGYGLTNQLANQIKLANQLTSALVLMLDLENQAALRPG